MSQWGQQSGFQYPMQTGMPGNPQFQQNPQLQQQQQNPQFQQGMTGGILPQRTGFPMQPQQTGFPGGAMQSQPTGYPGMQPQQTGFPGQGFLQSQATGYPGMMQQQPQQQQHRPAPPPPPVPPIPSQFQQQNQSHSFLSQPPQQNRFLSPSPAMGATMARPLVPQATGYVDPKLQMMSSTFMPTNTSMPYNAAGVPQLPSQQLAGGLNLQQSFQQQNQGSAPPRIPWALSRAEKKSYDQIFRAWDAQSTGFISGQNALEVFGQSGLSKDDLARIWTLADVDDRGKLNIAEFHVAMGLIYRKLNGNEIPNTLPSELVPPSARDLGGSVDILKDLLKNEPRSRSPSNVGAPVSYAKSRSFNSSNSSIDSARDASNYRHSDDGPSGVYTPRHRHIDRNTIRGNNDKSGAGDIDEMRHMLDNSSYMVDKTSQENAARSAEDEALDAERDDLKYRIKRLTEDLDYVSRGPRTASKEEDKRRFERELLSLRHEKLPELERKLKARDERREKEKRQWQRDRDRANERSGRYRDDRDDRYGSSRYDDRPYSRGSYDDDRYGRGGYRERSRSRDRHDRGGYEKDGGRDYPRDGDRDYHREGEDREYDRRPRSPVRARTPPPPPPAAPPSSIRDPPPAPKPAPSPAPATRNMTPAERQAYARERAQKLINDRKAALGLVVTPSATPVDTSVEDRLEQDKKAAEVKALAAEREAEEREKTRKERLEREKALKEGNGAPASPATAVAPPPPAPSATTSRAPPAPIGKKAPPPPKPRTSRGAAPAPPAPVAPPPQAQAARAPPPPAEPEVDPEEEALRERQEALKKQREARAARMKALEEMEREEELARKEEEQYNARMRALKERPSASPAPTPSAPVAAAPPVVATPPPPPPPPPATSPPVATPDKARTNPFSRLINQGAASPATSPAAAPAAAASTNPWAAKPAVSSPAVAPTPPPVSRTPSIPAPSGPKSYHTAPQDDDDDWDMVKEKEEEDDSSDDDITTSRSVRNDIANKLFGNLLPRPQSGAGSGPSSPAPGAKFSPPSASPAPPAPPPPPPPVGGAPPPPPPPPGGAVPPPSADRGALLSSIQGGLRLRPTKTVDKSGPPLSGKVLGDSAPPEHINAAPRAPSPPVPIPPPLAAPTAPSMDSGSSSRDNRQSVDWYAGLAADAGNAALPPAVPMTIEEELDEPEPEQHHAPIPDIQVDTVADPSSDLMADIDKSKELSVRSLFPFEGDGADDLSFGENLMIKANPSKTGGDWWYGTLVCTGKSGLFPKTYVQEATSVKAKALYTYTGANPDELSMAEGDEINIIDQSEEEWWKAEQGGVVFIVPAGYLEVVEDRARNATIAATSPKEAVASITIEEPIPETLSPLTSVVSPIPDSKRHSPDDDSDSDADSDSSDYQSFENSDDEPESKEDREKREKERQMVLEAAGLIVKKDVKPPPRPPKGKKRRPPPAAPQRQSVSSISSITKDLPPTPDTETNDQATHLNDAFDRYEAFRLTQNSDSGNRLSVASFDTGPSSPTTSVMTTTTSMSTAPSREGENRSYSGILNFLGRKTPVDSERRTLTISGPIMNNAEDLARPSSPAFGSSWASLVDKSALDGIPPNERRRQEAIFELIATETAYVRDLQLIVELFYSKLLPLLDRKAITVIFANIEDILLTNITFMSSLEERQKDCRLYIDRIGDIIQNYMSGMGVYMEYCVNQSNAIKVLQSIRDSNPEVASQLQRTRDDPAVRNLDLSSYLLIPMQRITRYPLLIRQILHYTEPGDEKEAIERSIEIAEKILDHINETIRFQEGQETLKKISQHLWIGQGRLDLTAPTRFMGPRKLLKEGVLMKAKSGKKLHAYLCSDILVLTDDKVRNLYRMPIALSESQVKDLPGNRDDLAFQVALPYPRGGEAIGLRATSARDCQLWMQTIESAAHKCKEAERRAARKHRS